MLSGLGLGLRGTLGKSKQWDGKSKQGLRRYLNPWEPKSCALQGGPSGRDHVVLTGLARPKELWELVWEHGAHVLVSLGLPDTKEKVRGVEGQDECLQEWDRGRGSVWCCLVGAWAEIWEAD